jgi:hypothetical protein
LRAALSSAPLLVVLPGSGLHHVYTHMLCYTTLSEVCSFDATPVGNDSID